MCGIYGTTRSYPTEIVEKKLERINFRGPDFSTFIPEHLVTYGHVRLSVIDLSERANQPMWYQYLLIVLNGEIYNYQVLKKELKGKGYMFTTTSDTEVLGAAYLEYGKQCVEKFNGMFAFAIYDAKNEIIFGARDRLGKKPYFYSLKDGFEFGSQPSAIKIGRTDITTDEESVQKYLLFGHVPEPDSIYREIKKIPPGTSFTYSIHDKEFVLSPFWTLQQPLTYARSYEDAKHELSNLLDDAVAIRLQADVNLGVFLSGGIDSTLMTALCKKHKDTIEAFSVGFPGSNFDESIDAKNTAKYMGVKHTIINCNPKDALELVDGFTNYYDEPFADSSAIPSMLLCKKVKPYATVAISGDGGDESFIGYLRTKWINQVLAIYKIPQSLRIIFANIIAIAPNYRIKSIARGLKHERIEDLIMKLLASQFYFSKEKILGLPAYQNLINQDSVSLSQKMVDLDLQFYMLNDCNVKMDRAAAFAGIEVRSPLLDYRVVEFARSLPIEFRFGKGVQKRILKDILYTYVPQKMMDRPKSGFAIPLQDWFRDELKNYVYDVLSDENLDRIPFIDKGMIRKNTRLHMENKLNFSVEIWKLIVLIKWQQENG